MRRNAWHLAACLISLLTISGCSFLKKPATEPASVGTNDYDFDPAVSPTFASTSPTSDSPAAPIEIRESVNEPNTAPPSAEAASKNVYHTVVKKDTLFGLARQYYGNEHRWKDIFKANASVIHDPDLIHVGDRLVIP